MSEATDVFGDDALLKELDKEMSRAESAEADANRLAEALEALTDPDPCTLFDHHGYCQTHGWLSDPCGHEVARSTLRLHKEQGE